MQEQYRGQCFLGLQGRACSLLDLPVAPIGPRFRPVGYRTAGQWRQALPRLPISAGATDPLAFVNTSMGRPFSSTFTVTYNVPVPVLNFFVKPVSTSGRFGNILFGLGS